MENRTEVDQSDAMDKEKEPFMSTKVLSMVFATLNLVGSFQFYYHFWVFGIPVIVYILSHSIYTFVILGSSHRKKIHYLIHRRKDLGIFFTFLVIGWLGLIGLVVLAFIIVKAWRAK